MPTISPFTPQPGTSGFFIATVASQTLALPTGGGSQVRVVNGGSATVFLAFGVSTITASATTDMPLLAGQSEIFTVDFGSRYSYIACASLASAAAQIVIFTKGEGF